MGNHQLWPFGGKDRRRGRLSNERSFYSKPCLLRPLHGFLWPNRAFKYLWHLKTLTSTEGESKSLRRLGEHLLHLQKTMRSRKKNQSLLYSIIMISTKTDGWAIECMYFNPCPLIPPDYLTWRFGGKRRQRKPACNKKESLFSYS